MSDSVRKEKFPIVLPPRFFPCLEGKVLKPVFDLASDVEEKSESEEAEDSDDTLFKRWEKETLSSKRDQHLPLKRDDKRNEGTNPSRDHS
ncbi:hypothetical protein R1flu_028085 [Riccia fluitans]|uniref:Uncharacterized protein n=1 Tax=Riccia fluitans TaxID=41844 RepID=A0ABD1XKN6_9MARC